MRTATWILVCLLTAMMMGGVALVESRRSVCLTEKREAQKLQKRYSEPMENWRKTRKLRAAYHQLRFFEGQPLRIWLTGSAWTCSIATSEEEGWRLQRLKWKMTRIGFEWELVGAVDGDLEESFSRVLHRLSEQTDLIVLESERSMGFKSAGGMPGFRIRGTGELQ